MANYDDRDPLALEPFYTRHLSAMTSEHLHDKKDIAAELAWRDLQVMQFRRLLAEVCHGLDIGDDLRSDHPPPPIDFSVDSVDEIRDTLMARAVLGAMKGDEV